MGINVISGNKQDGVLLSNTSTTELDNVVSGNYIGVGVNGSTRVANRQNGVEIDGQAEDMIGGGNCGQGNVISGNILSGIYIHGSTAQYNYVEGNLIGTDLSGKVPVGNNTGIYLQANNNFIGAATGTPTDSPHASNVISGNYYYGVEIAGNSNLLVNNYIGTDVTGTQRISNGWGGINVGWSRPWVNSPPATVVAANNTIGGTGGLNSTLNVISGNGDSAAQGGYGNGISLYGSGVQGTVIQGNYVGVNVEGTAGLGNAADGIAIGNAIAPGTSPSNTTIGGAAAADGNVISANGTKFNRGGPGFGVGADGTGLLQNNTIGYDANGQDQKKVLKNQGGEVSLPPTGWTSLGNKVQ